MFEVFSRILPPDALAPLAVWAAVGAPVVGVVGLLMGLTWLVALKQRDASVVDAMWAIGFVLVTWASYAVTQGHGFEPRRLAVFALVTLWGARLGFHLLERHAREGEDRRYAAMRHRWGAAFAWKSLVLVFGLQGLLMVIIASPVLAVMAVPAANPPHLLDLVGGVVSTLGLLCEALADRQLASFKAKPENAGRVMDTGLWRYSRHPNYFGESLFWSGLGLFGVAVGATWTLASPALLTLLLLRVSGVTLMEKSIGERRPEYAAYVARTNAFFPGRRRPD